MNVPEFTAKWRQVELTERSAYQQDFLDLCRVFEHPTRRKYIRGPNGSHLKRALKKMVEARLA